MIEVADLRKNFNKLEVLKDVSFSIKQGEIYGIIGHSGAGKSTLLRCINGLEAYDSGVLQVMDQEIKNLTQEELRKFRKNITMIFQNFSLLNRASVYKNIALPLEIWGYEKKYIEDKVGELLKLVGLEDKRDYKPKQLSGGQKQRVAIARALTLNPKILLCDEATSALDPKTTKDILQLLLKINKTLGITIVVVTHEMEVIKEICEKVLLLEDGRVKAEGYVEKLFLNPGLSLRKFLGEEDEDVIPEEGVNIKIFFPTEISHKCLITKMSRELDVDFSIVWGKLEKFRNSILGSLVINLSKDNKEKIIKYLETNKFQWEVL